MARGGDVGGGCENLDSARAWGWLRAHRQPAGHGIALLASSPEQRRLPAERGDLWPSAVDELFRVDPPCSSPDA